MQDIRLLKLFKQYAQDPVPIAYEVTYCSCGYYDGFEIVKAAPAASRLFTVDAEAPTSMLYYGASKAIGSLAIGKSMQIMGLFRCVSEPSDQQKVAVFWRLAEQLPYFAVGFLQLRNGEYRQRCQEVEQAYDIPFDGKQEAGCRCLTYLTYDHTDFIVFLASNSMTYMMQTLQTIESRPYFSCKHHIFGVAKRYLAAFQQAPKPLTNWNGINCNIDEKIQQMEMKFVASGHEQRILAGLKYGLDQIHLIWNIKNYEKMTYAHTSGYANLLLRLPDTDVKSFLSLLLPKSILTHPHFMYPNGVYHIETSIYIREKNWSSIHGQTNHTYETRTSGWCRKLIKKYTQYMDSEFQRGDEGFHSYFQSLLSILHTLHQYETNSVSKDLFLMVYPALKLFDKLFMEAYANLSDTGDRNDHKSRTLKDALEHFIVYINSIIRHAVPTNLFFLRIPEYSGTSCSIPIKLNLMYDWFANAIQELLNDENIICQCLLIPKMETIPKSQLFDPGIKTTDRLLYIFFSQRTIFLPRNLMIILTHEISRYIGKNIRLRKERWTHLLRSTIRYIVESLLHRIQNLSFPKGEQEYIYEQYQTHILPELEKKIFYFLEASCTPKLQDQDYGGDMADTLKNGIYQMLTLKNGELETILRQIPEALAQKLDEPEEFIKYHKYIYNIQLAMVSELKGMAYSGWIEYVIDLLMRTYRNVFSDIVTVDALQCSFQDYLEAYQVSEGIILSENNRSDERSIRELAVSRVIFQEQSQLHMHEFGEKTEEPYIAHNLYRYEWARSEILQYANECHWEISKRFLQSACKNSLKSIRELFSLFKNGSQNELDLPQSMHSVTAQYIQNVKKDYQTSNALL